MAGEAATPGWYPDPAGGNGQRYWDGAAWGPVAPGMPAKMLRPTSSNRSWLIGGLVAVVLMGGFIALVTGHGKTPVLDKDGTYYRIDSSSAGTYATDGSQRQNGRPCNWERARAATGHISDAIEAGTVDVGERGQVQLHAGDYFVTYGCKPWRKR